MNTNDIAEKAQDWQEKAEDLREQAQNFQEKARQAAMNATRATDQYVRDNPWTTLLIASLAGCALGFLLARSKD